MMDRTMNVRAPALRNPSRSDIASSWDPGSMSWGAGHRLAGPTACSRSAAGSATRWARSAERRVSWEPTEGSRTPSARSIRPPSLRRDPPDHIAIVTVVGPGETCSGHFAVAEAGTSVFDVGL